MYFQQKVFYQFKEILEFHEFVRNYEIYKNSTLLQLKNAVCFLSKKYFNNSKKFFYEFVLNSSVVDVLYS